MALDHEVRPSRIRPAAELAERVLLPGDPARALAVAQALLERAPRMFNHARGLWGYTGTASDGELLTIQATGMGGPSAAIVCEELIALGARRLVRIGTCGVLDPDISPGEAWPRRACSGCPTSWHKPRAVHTAQRCLLRAPTEPGG